MNEISKIELNAAGGYCGVPYYDKTDLHRAYKTGSKSKLGE